MKIAMLSQSYPPMVSGAALFSQRLAQHLAAQGHTVLVLAASDRGSPYRTHTPHLTIERLPAYHNPYRVGQCFTLWPHRQVLRCLEAFAPDVIHLHDPFQLGLSALAYARPRRVPVVATIHMLPVFVGKCLPLWRAIAAPLEAGLWRYGGWVLRRCTQGVAATETTARAILAHTGVLPQVISCGVDLHTFHPAGPTPEPAAAALRRQLGLPPGVPVILHVGRLDIDKRAEAVVQAAARAMQRTPAHLLVVGDGTERPHLEALCARLGIAGRSHFPGFIPVAAGTPGGLPDVYRLGTVFAAACEIETQGLVLLEAAASGLPIVAVQATCLHEIVHEGENGYLLPPGDLDGMAARLAELTGDPGRAQAMGQAGRQVVERHAAQRSYAAYEALYRDCLQAARRCTPAPTRPGRRAHLGRSG